jgi:hypothetical protein
VGRQLSAVELGLDLPRDQLVDEGAGGCLDLAVGLGQRMASCTRASWSRGRLVTAWEFID